MRDRAERSGGRYRAHGARRLSRPLRAARTAGALLPPSPRRLARGATCASRTRAEHASGRSKRVSAPSKRASAWSKRASGRSKRVSALSKDRTAPCALRPAPRARHRTVGFPFARLGTGIDDHRTDRLRVHVRRSKQLHVTHPRPAREQLLRIGDLCPAPEAEGHVRLRRLDVRKGPVLLEDGLPPWSRRSPPARRRARATPADR